MRDLLRREALPAIAQEEEQTRLLLHFLGQRRCFPNRAPGRDQPVVLQQQGRRPSRGGADVVRQFRISRRQVRRHRQARNPHREVGCVDGKNLR